jgi:hypothetical protein
MARPRQIAVRQAAVLFPDRSLLVVSVWEPAWRQWRWLRRPEIPGLPYTCRRTQLRSLRSTRQRRSCGRGRRGGRPAGARARRDRGCRAGCRRGRSRDGRTDRRAARCVRGGGGLARARRLQASPPWLDDPARAARRAPARLGGARAVSPRADREGRWQLETAGSSSATACSTAPRSDKSAPSTRALIRRTTSSPSGGSFIRRG